MRHAGKIVLVTGAAQGIGLACAERFHAEGARIVMVDLGEDHLRAAAEGLGERAAVVRADLSAITAKDAAAIVGRAVELFGGLDVLVNNAGIALVQALVDTSLEQWRQVHAVNLDGVFLGTREAVRAMRPGGRAGRGGSIVNISSVGGLIGSERLTAYCSTKGGVRLFSKSVAIECGRAGYGIRVNSVHPGNTDTPMFRRELQDMLDKGMAANLEEARKFFMDMQVLPMIGEPGDVAAMVLFLASDAARFITGAEFVVDGGLTAQ